MVKRIVLFTALLLLLPGLAHATKTVRVGVLPFTVYGKEDLNFLRTGIQEMLNNQFLDHGVNAVSKADVQRVLGARAFTEVSEQSAREFGRALDVDYIIYGSLTKIGRSISVDARIVDTFGLKRTTAVFVQGEGLENLVNLIKDLAVKATFKVTERQQLIKIIISGNKRIETDAIKTVLKSQEGDIFSKEKISQDLKNIYAMNYFEDVKVEVEDSEDGKIVHFIVDEKPSIRLIEFKGNRNLKEEDLSEVVGYALYSILDTKKIIDSVENINELYREKGYYNAKVAYEIDNIGPKMVAIRYTIKEGGRVYIKKIEFIGNENISRKKLLKILKTKEKGFWSWIADKGILKKDELKEDTSKLLTHYQNNGYLKVQVADPIVEVEKDGIVVTFRINEGPQYKVGQVSFSGDLIETEEKLFSLIEIHKQPFFNREIVQKDIQKINSVYTSHGYAYAAVSPMLREHEDTFKVDIDFKITKNRLVYIERIEIVGNSKTRDKVIRREFKINEGDLFSTEGLRKSAMNLNRLGYFSDVRFSQAKGSADDKLNIKVEVVEQPTGAFSIGAGYSSYNKVFGVFQISQNNFRGKGQRIQFQGNIGARSSEYMISFIEPWLWDIPLLAGFDVYNQTREYYDYDKDATGGIVRLGYPIMDYVRLSGRYKYEDADIKNITEGASMKLEAMEGNWKTSSIAATIRRDTRNRFFNPTSGSDNSLTVEYAGGLLGGTSYFTKYILNSGWFFPLPWGDEHVFFVRGKLGYIQERSGGRVPIFEKFVLGGINSLRGFNWGAIGPQDPDTGTVLGGSKMILFNLEYIFPLIKDAGLMGVIFFDTGNAFDFDESIDLGNLRKSAGAGLRFYSPLGPLRLEWGYVLDPKPGEKRSTWEFTIGTFF
ncbi:MAG: outer membrane protein assembly factor BamA [Deltaproteobacteria bacterium]|nr:outer membrane protein assembly factor BamA [Deltaproteobacteria bacterium]